MEIYTLLGINKDATIDEIRAAYAQKLKDIDMSRDLEGYQNLRAAYNQAVKNIDQSKDSPSFIETKSSEVTREELITEIAPEKIKKIEEPLEITNEPTEVQVTTTNIPVAVEDDPTEISFTEHFNSFLAQKEFYNNFSTWEDFLDLFIVESVQKYIISFLSSNFMLLDDNTRLKLVKYCHIDENSFETQEEKDIFLTHIQRDNFLDYNFYTYIPKDSRNSYFKLRYKLYEIIQKEDTSNQLSATELNQLKKSNYQDYDLDFLLSVYALIKPNSMSLVEIHERLEYINTDKYHHDVAIIQNVLYSIESSNFAKVTNASIISLTWVSDDVKEQLIDRLNELKHAAPKTNSNPTKRTKQPVKPYKPFNLKRAILLFIFGIFILFSLLGLLFSNSRSSPVPNILDDFTFSDDDEWDYLNDYEEEFDNLSYKLEYRANNVKLNYDVYNFLFWDYDIDDGYDALSFQTLDFLTDFKSTYSEELTNMDLTDIFSDIKETHDLDEKQNIITYSRFVQDENLAIKSVTSSENNITSMEIVKPEQVPVNDSLGSIDATLFFSEDLSDNYDDLDGYLTELDELYSRYMTDNLYESLQEMDAETYGFLTNFTYTKPFLIGEKTLVLFSDYGDVDPLVLELDDELKIKQLYGDYFEDIPTEWISIIEKITPPEDFGNPWLYEIGRN